MIRCVAFVVVCCLLSPVQAAGIFENENGERVADHANGKQQSFTLGQALERASLEDSDPQLYFMLLYCSVFAILIVAFSVPVLLATLLSADNNEVRQFVQKKVVDVFAHKKLPSARAHHLRSVREAVLKNRKQHSLCDVPAAASAALRQLFAACTQTAVNMPAATVGALKAVASGVRNMARLPWTRTVLLEEDLLCKGKSEKTIAAEPPKKKKGKASKKAKKATKTFVARELPLEKPPRADDELSDASKATTAGVDSDSSSMSLQDSPVPPMLEMDEHFHLLTCESDESDTSIGTPGVAAVEDFDSDDDSQVGADKSMLVPIAPPPGLELAFDVIPPPGLPPPCFDFLGA